MDGMPAVVDCAAYAGGVRVGDLSIDAIDGVLKQPDRFVWLGLVEPDKDLLSQIQQEFDLHDLAIEDALNGHQRPKIEQYRNSLFIVLRAADPARSAAPRVGETQLFVGSVR
jgi:magnesium transporter